MTPIPTRPTPSSPTGPTGPGRSPDRSISSSSDGNGPATLPQQRERRVEPQYASCLPLVLGVAGALLDYELVGPNLGTTWVSHCGGLAGRPPAWHHLLTVQPQSARAGSTRHHCSSRQCCQCSTCARRGPEPTSFQRERSHQRAGRDRISCRAARTRAALSWAVGPSGSCRVSSSPIRVGRP
jgi:hypothetical protein